MIHCVPDLCDYSDVDENKKCCIGDTLDVGGGYGLNVSPLPGFCRVDGSYSELLPKTGQ